MSHQAPGRYARSAVRVQPIHLNSIQILPLICGLLAGCSPADKAEWLAWPELRPNTLAFLIQDGEQPAVLGPFEPVGPEPPLYLPSSALILLEVDRGALSAVHPLVDQSALTSATLGDVNPSCGGCDGTCLGAKREEILASIPSSSRVWHRRDGEALAPATLDLVSSQRLRLLTNPNCEGRRPATVMPFAALPSPGQWSRTFPAGRNSAWVLGSDLLLVESDGTVRALSEQRSYAEVKDIVLEPEGSFLAVTNGPSEVLRVSTSSAGIEVKDVWALPSATTLGIARSEGGGFAVVVAGEATIWVSERGESARRLSLPGSRTFTAIIASPFVSGEFFLSAGFGYVWSAALFKEAPELKEIRIMQVDKQVSRFAVRTGPAGPELWARTNGRGLYRRGTDQQWRFPEVSAMPDADACVVSPTCGFHDVSIDVIELATAGPDVFVTAGACPALLWLRPELGCATRLELPSESPSVRGLSGSERGVWALSGRSLVEVWVR